MKHAREFGFFLDINRFLDVYSRNPRSSSIAILLNVIYLLGAKLSSAGVPQVQNTEQAFLGNALHYLQTALPEEPRNGIYVMQAEVLLANYFFNGNRHLEGIWHTNAAVSIATASGLHLIRSNRHSQNAANSYRLPPPADALEEGERINGFWTVFILDRCWAIATGSAPAFTDNESLGTQIDTPWPMDLSAYRNVSLSGYCSSDGN